MKQHFLLIDTETTATGLVADFGAVVVDRKGRIATQCGVLTGGIFTDPDSHPLFYNEDAGELWNKASLARRYENYRRMLQSGSRMVASPAAINSWLAKAAIRYNPIMTAYNLAFDVDKCNRTGIDLTVFPERFCLWHTSVKVWAHSRAYRRMVMDSLAFNSPTKHGNMSYKTNAETMARFVTDNPELPDEPHTALEDCIDYELPILKRLLAVRSTRKILAMGGGFDWRDYQVRDWFRPS